MGVQASAVTTSTYTPVLITSFPLNPLTTTFTPPAPCSGIYESTVGIIDDRISCLPSGFSVPATDFFSPGIDCPSGYYTACHDTTGVQSITTVTCCPFRGDISLSCVDPAGLAGVWATLFCSWIAPSLGTGVTMTLSDNGVTSTIVSQLTSPGGLNAFGVRMVYEATDTSSKTSTTKSATGASQTSTNTDTTSATQSATASVLPNKGDGGLSTGGIVAIAVVVPIVVLALLGVSFFFWKRRKQTYNTVTPAGSSGPQDYYGNAAKLPGQGGPPELYGSSGKPGGIPHSQPVEMGDSTMPIELPDKPRQHI